MNLDSVTAWGVTRPLRAWLRSPICRVDETEFVRRVDAGWPAESALSSPRGAAPPPNVQQEADRIPGYDQRPASIERPTSNRGRRKNQYSRYYGVTQRKGGKFYAQIRLDRNTVKFLGGFESEVAAAVAFDVEARKLGRLKLNFPNGAPQ